MTDLTVSCVPQLQAHAGALLDDVRAADSEACARTRSVFRDLAVPDEEVRNNFGIQRAQHVIAVEAEFANWTTLKSAPPLAQHLARVMLDVPLLNDFGIGFTTGTWEHCWEHYQNSRKALKASVTRVADTIDWLRTNIEPTKRINLDRNSYGYKNDVARDIGYITNGVFIAAAILVGYPHEIDERRPNVPFGMSKRSFRRVHARQQDRRTEAAREAARQIQYEQQRSLQEGLQRIRYPKEATPSS